MTDISALRLNLLRACYLLLVVGLSLNFWPEVLSGAATRPLMEGVVNAMLGAVGLLAVLTYATCRWKSRRFALS